MTQNLCVFNIYGPSQPGPQMLFPSCYGKPTSLPPLSYTALFRYPPFEHLEFAKRIGYEKKKVFQMKETK